MNEVRPNIVVSAVDHNPDGLTTEESARRKSTLEDFEKRGDHVKKILETEERFARSL